MTREDAAYAAALNLLGSSPEPVCPALQATLDRLHAASDASHKVSLVKGRYTVRVHQVSPQRVRLYGAPATLYRVMDRMTGHMVPFGQYGTRKAAENRIQRQSDRDARRVGI